MAARVYFKPIYLMNSVLQMERLILYRGAIVAHVQ